MKRTSCTKMKHLRSEARVLKFTKRRAVPDFICYGKIILELKAMSDLTDSCRAQVHNYLKATGYRLALLINFGHYPGVEIERIVR